MYIRIPIFILKKKIFVTFDSKCAKQVWPCFIYLLCSYKLKQKQQENVCILHARPNVGAFFKGALFSILRVFVFNTCKKLNCTNRVHFDAFDYYSAYSVHFSFSIRFAFRYSYFHSTYHYIQIEINTLFSMFDDVFCEFRN